MVIGSMELLSAPMQGIYVRRSIPEVGEGVIARGGSLNWFCALFVLSVVPRLIFSQNQSSNAAAGAPQLFPSFMAYTSATVVDLLTSYAHLRRDDTTEEKDQVTDKQNSEEHRICSMARRWAGFALGVGLVRLPGHFLVVIRLLPSGSCLFEIVTADHNYRFR